MGELEWDATNEIKFVVNSGIERGYQILDSIVILTSKNYNLYPIPNIRSIIILLFWYLCNVGSNDGCLDLSSCFIICFSLISSFSIQSRLDIFTHNEFYFLFVLFLVLHYSWRSKPLNHKLTPNLPGIQENRIWNQWDSTASLFSKQLQTFNQ